MGSSTVVATVLPEWQNTNNIAWMWHCYRYCIFWIQSRTGGEKDSNGNAANNQHCLCSFFEKGSHIIPTTWTHCRSQLSAPKHTWDCLPNNWNYILIEFDFSACSFHLSISPIALKSPESSLKQMQHHKLNPLSVCGLCIYSRFQVFGARLLSNQSWI